VRVVDRCASLTSVSLSGTLVGNDIANARRRMAIETLELSKCKSLTNVTFTDARWPSLKSLTLSGSPQLSMVTLSLPSLTSLNMSSSKLLTSLWLRSIHSLTDLNLSQCAALADLRIGLVNGAVDPSLAVGVVAATPPTVTPLVPSVIATSSSSSTPPLLSTTTTTNVGHVTGIIRTLNMFMCRSLTSSSLLWLLRSCSSTVTHINCEGLRQLTDILAMDLFCNERYPLTSIASLSAIGCAQLSSSAITRLATHVTAAIDRRAEHNVTTSLHITTPAARTMVWPRVYSDVYDNIDGLDDTDNNNSSSNINNDAIQPL
jgi:hypothetical protein